MAATDRETIRNHAAFIWSVTSWLMLAAIGFVLLWPYGPWLALPIIAYGLAWLSYRAAIHAAAEYGVALFVLLDLNHAALLERFQLHDAPQGPLQRARYISRTAVMIPLMDFIS